MQYLNQSQQKNLKQCNLVTYERRKYDETISPEYNATTAQVSSLFRLLSSRTMYSNHVVKRQLKLHKLSTYKRS